MGRILCVLILFVPLVFFFLNFDFSVCDDVFDIAQADGFVLEVSVDCIRIHLLTVLQPDVTVDKSIVPGINSQSSSIGVLLLTSVSVLLINTPCMNLAVAADAIHVADTSPNRSTLYAHAISTRPAPVWKSFEEFKDPSFEPDIDTSSSAFSENMFDASFFSEVGHMDNFEEASSSMIVSSGWHEVLETSAEEPLKRLSLTPPTRFPGVVFMMTMGNSDLQVYGCVFCVCVRPFVLLSTGCHGVLMHIFFFC
jgi:hypothetical protein